MEITLFSDDDLRLYGSNRRCGFGEIVQSTEFSMNLAEHDRYKQYGVVQQKDYNICSQYYGSLVEQSYNIPSKSSSSQILLESKTSIIQFIIKNEFYTKKDKFLIKRAMMKSASWAVKHCSSDREEYIKQHPKFLEELSEEIDEFYLKIKNKEKEEAEKNAEIKDQVNSIEEVPSSNTSNSQLTWRQRRDIRLKRMFNEIKNHNSPNVDIKEEVKHSPKRPSIILDEDTEACHQRLRDWLKS